jgi:MFS family permease
VPPTRTRATRALEVLNVFMSDIQAGIGPFLGVFLQAKGWSPAAIGSVMSIGGLCGVAVTGPLGALVDVSHRKRSLVFAACLISTVGSALLWFLQSFAWVTVSQIATAVAGAALGPAVAGLTLGIVHPRGFDRQMGRNQTANHAGNFLGAALSGWLGLRFGFDAIFTLATVFGLLSMLSVLWIPRAAIDDEVARGLTSGAAREPVAGLRVLLGNRPLLVLAAALMLFHLANAAMLPLYGLAVVAAHQGNPLLFTAETIGVAQLVMVGASLFAMRWLRTQGAYATVLLAFAVLPVRGVLAAFAIRSWGVWPVQALDGVGAGILSVAVPALVAHLLRGTGRVNVGQGAVITVQGIGASLSPAIAGAIAQVAGYRTAFLALATAALAALAVWVRFRHEIVAAATLKIREEAQPTPA